MSRVALAVLAAGLLLGAGPATRALDPHVDPTLLPAGCMSCHEGHGASRSPMLAKAQVEVCLDCHESEARAGRQVLNGRLELGVQTSTLARALAQPYLHPLTKTAYSRREPGAVTCSSCHSPHRSPRGGALAPAPGGRKLSPRDPARFEYELCQECHGAAGNTTRSFTDISRLLSPASSSYHPIEAPAVDGSPSVLPALRGAEINCTDCHGNSDPAGAAGPHGSAVRHLLVAEYTTVDGGPESAAAYALCYTCHDREQVLDGTAFPLHREHVVAQRASCATCHSAHGSVGNRALIRFGEETFLGGVGPSADAGRLAFESLGPGSGRCYLTCHGVDHAPASYGAGAFTVGGPAGRTR